MTDIVKLKTIDYVSKCIDTIFNNGDYIELDIRQFLSLLDNKINKRKADFIINVILSTSLVEPIKEFDADIGEYFQNGELKISDKGIVELNKYKTFLKYWHLPRQRLKRLMNYTISPIVFILKTIKKSLDVVNTISTIILSLVTVVLLIITHNKDTRMEQISKDKDLLNQTVDSLNTLITQEQSKTQMLKCKDSVENTKTYSK